MTVEEIIRRIKDKGYRIRFSEFREMRTDTGDVKWSAHHECEIPIEGANTDNFLIWVYPNDTGNNLPTVNLSLSEWEILLIKGIYSWDRIYDGVHINGSVRFIKMEGEK